MKPTYDQVVDALGPLLNDKALRRVTSLAETARGMGDIGDAIALEMLLSNHEKRSAALKSLAAAQAPANPGGDHEVAQSNNQLSLRADGSPSIDPSATFNNGSR